MTPYAMLPLNAAVASVRLTGYTVTSNLRFLQECGRATLRLNPFFVLAKPVATATDPKPSGSKSATVAKAKTKAKPAPSRAVKSEPKAKPKRPRKPSLPPSMPT